MTRVEWVRQPADKLPDGWFSEPDRQTYRKLVSAVLIGGRMAELGCWKGRSLCSVADIIIARQIEVYAVDTFKGNRDQPQLLKAAEDQDIRAIFEENLKAFGIHGDVCICQRSTDEAAMEFEISCDYGSMFDLVFVDACHVYEDVKRDIENWMPLLHPGGVIAGHDYVEVQKAVQELIPHFQVEGDIWYGHHPALS